MATKEKVKKKGKPALSEAEKAARAEMLKNESKADKFKRLAAPRVKAAVKAIRLIGNTAGSGYESTPEQIETIRALLTGELTATLKKFEGKKAAGEITVSL